MMQIGILEPDRFPARALEILYSLGAIHSNDEPFPSPSFLAGMDVAVIRLKHRFDKPLLDQAPNLKIICTATTGLDHIDLAETAARGISVLSLRGETDFLKTVTATAEHTWGLLLSLIRHIPQAHQSVVHGNWDRTPFFGRELQDRTLGIVGLGRIGQMVARYGLAFRMRVLAYDPFQTEWIEGVERIQSLHSLLPLADVLSVHVPLEPETTRLIGEEELDLLRPGAVLLNTSRGAVIDEEALLDALECGDLGAAALDVIHDEYDATSTLRERITTYASAHANLLLTPHLGGATHDSLEKVEIFMAGKLARHIAALAAERQ